MGKVVKLKRYWLLSFLRVLSVIIAFTCIFLAVYDGRFSQPFWLLPTVYSITLLLVRHNIVISSPGIYVLNVVMFFRYSITPLALYITGELSRFANNYQHLDGSIWLMIYELVSVMIVIQITGMSQRRATVKKMEIKDNKQFKEFKRSKITVIFVIGIVVFLAVNYRQLTGGFSLITRGTTLIASEQVSGVPGLVGIIWQASLAWIFIYTCLKLKKADKNIGKTIIISAVYILLTFIGQTSISRWYTVISFIAVYFTLLKLYPKEEKTLFKWILIPSGILILIVTLYKNTTFLLEGNSVLESIVELFAATNLDSYFAGPVNVNSAIGVINSHGFGFSTIFYDLLNNMPIANHFIDGRLSSVNMFNVYIGRVWNGISGDQIIPLVGQSSMYFSYLFAPSLSILAVIYLRLFDTRFYYSQTPMMYAYAFISAWIGVVIILNLTIFMSWIYIRVIPLMLLIAFTEITDGNNIKIKRRGY